MKLKSSSFADNGPIPAEFAFGKHEPTEHMTLSDNKNPAFSWEGAPDGTQSFVMICHDIDVPTQLELVNQEDKVIPASLPRTNFFHWVLVDLPATANAIEVGEFSNGVTPKGKPGPEAPNGTRQGVNNYTEFMAGDPDMGGTYFGYDGPCPPWNDEIVHHYIFTLYALDVPRCDVTGQFGGEDVLAAIDGHVLAQAQITGLYAINPAVTI
ncbi:MAG TPA: phospholipid-binding protein [Gammaproteobacteria bacterium]|nr:phospholipid-binding protein [Gammaproteobacteria bacterium]